MDKKEIAYKYAKLKNYFGREDLLPLWVADMEFESPRCVAEVVKEVAECGFWGYNVEPNGFKPAISSWLNRIQGWKIENEWVTFIPGIVRGIALVLDHFTTEGDGVVVQTPVYHPFMNVTRDNGRKLIFNPLIKDQYKMDLEGLERVTSENNCKVLILCNPHNPGGIIWSEGDLLKVAEICHRKGILVISDEIHADLQLWGNSHIPFASVSPEAAKISITFGAPSKTFNIPGLACSYAIVPNPELRDNFYGWLSCNEFNSVPLISSLAAIAVYNTANSWRLDTIKAIEENIILLEQFFSENDMGIEVIRPQASFLVWLDCRELEKRLGGRKVADYFINDLRLALNDGAMFGPEGKGFMRMNVGAPKEMIQDAISRIAIHSTKSYPRF